MRASFSIAFVFATAVLAGAPGFARAATHVSVAQWMPGVDTQQRGSVDLAQVKKAGDATFDRLDRNHDGKLDRQEAAAAGVDRTAFMKADPDGDGTLDKAEYDQLVASRFAAADPERDDKLDVRELDSPAGQALLRLVS